MFLVAVFWVAAFIALPGQAEYYMWINEAAFTGGIWMGLHLDEAIKRIGPWYRKLRVWIPIAYLVCVVLFVFLGFMHMRILSNRVRYLLIPFGCASLWVISPWLVKMLRPVQVVYSFNVFIFAIHFVVLWRVRALLESFGCNFRSVGFMAAQFVLTVAVCFGLGLLMKRFFPKTLAFLSGGRK